MELNPCCLWLNPGVQSAIYSGGHLTIGSPAPCVQVAIGRIALAAVSPLHKIESPRFFKVIPVAMHRLANFFGGTTPFESDLVGNPKDMFSHDAPHSTA